MNSRGKAYWKVTSPAAVRRNHWLFINGLAAHPYGIPGIECPNCDSWAGSRILPFQCPPALRRYKALRNRWPIPVEAHKALVKKVEGALQRDGIHAVLQPGDSFQPAVLCLFCRPRFDFYWPVLGSAIVSQRARTVLLRVNITGIRFCKSVIEKVGRAEPLDGPPELKGREPEEMLDLIGEQENPRRFGPLWEMVVEKESGIPPGVVVGGVCPLCGFQAVNIDEREQVLMEGILPDVDVFILGTTRHIVVSDRVKKTIEDNNLSNISFEEVGFRQ